MPAKTITAYSNDPSLKAGLLANLAAHREADELVKGQYWEDGKGCAVGCTIHSWNRIAGKRHHHGNHGVYDDILGPGGRMLGRLEDSIFEGLPNGEARAWPERFMSAVRPGADLSLVGWKLLHWLLTDPIATPGINHPSVRDAVKQCADVVAALAKGMPADASAAWSAASAASAARSAASAESAASAARSAASAESAASAAWSAASAASAARSAASAESAASAARSAASAAWSAASAARSAESAASAAWVRISDKLVELIEAA